MKELDETDRRSAALLQKDDRLSLADLGKHIGLSHRRSTSASSGSARAASSKAFTRTCTRRRSG